MMNTLADDYQPPEDQGLSVIYKDDTLLVIDKPTGLLSVPGRGERKQDCLLSRVRIEYPDALIVHRLDMETSGIIVLARNKEAQRKLSLMFEEREIQKRYIAVVHGCVPDASGVVELPLICDWPNRPKQMVDHDRGKPHARLVQEQQPRAAHQGAADRKHLLFST